MVLVLGIELTAWMVVFTACALWLSDARIWKALFLASLLTGLMTNSLTLSSLVSIVFLLAACKVLLLESPMRYVGLIVLLVVGLCLGLHILPGFNNQEYLSGHQLSQTAAPFSIWFNYDKSLFGILLLGMLFHPVLIRDRKVLFEVAERSWLLMFVGIGVVYLLGFLIGYAQLDWTPSAQIWPWALKNIFFTVIAEEILFRGLIQRELYRIIPGAIGKHVAVVGGAVLFGSAHFAGGGGYVLLSTLAGLIYGYVYLRSGKIEAAIFAHFLLNIVHFLVFSYPYSIA